MNALNYCIQKVSCKALGRVFSNKEFVDYLSNVLSGIKSHYKSDNLIEDALISLINDYEPALYKPSDADFIIENDKVVQKPDPSFLTRSFNELIAHDSLIGPIIIDELLKSKDKETILLKMLLLNASKDSLKVAAKIDSLVPEEIYSIMHQVKVYGAYNPKRLKKIIDFKNSLKVSEESLEIFYDFLKQKNNYLKLKNLKHGHEIQELLDLLEGTMAKKANINNQLINSLLMKDSTYLVDPDYYLITNKLRSIMRLKPKKCRRLEDLLDRLLIEPDLDRFDNSISDYEIILSKRSHESINSKGLSDKDLIDKFNNSFNYLRDKVLKQNKNKRLNTELKIRFEKLRDLFTTLPEEDSYDYYNLISTLVIKPIINYVIKNTEIIDDADKKMPELLYERLLSNLESNKELIDDEFTQFLKNSELSSEDFDKELGDRLQKIYKDKKSKKDLQSMLLLWHLSRVCNKLRLNK